MILSFSVNSYLDRTLSNTYLDRILYKQILKIRRTGFAQIANYLTALKFLTISCCFFRLSYKNKGRILSNTYLDRILSKSI